MNNVSLSVTPGHQEQAVTFAYLTVIQLSYQPSRHLGDARVDRPGGADIL